MGYNDDRRQCLKSAFDDEGLIRIAADLRALPSCLSRSVQLALRLAHKDILDVPARINLPRKYRNCRYFVLLTPMAGNASFTIQALMFTVQQEKKNGVVV
jgi:hypothetical protein